MTAPATADSGAAGHYDADSLYALLPEAHRRRDAELGYPLRDLITVLAEQAGHVAQDIERLCDNSFIETCATWAVPYLGDLLGLRPLSSGRSARAEVANTVGYRRRKGTPAVLEDVARDVTGWPARAVELFQLLVSSQFLDHVRHRPAAFAHIRDAGAMARIDSPFDTTAHTLDVRRIETREGWHNIPHVGLFVWRLRAYPRHLVEPAKIENVGVGGCFTFEPLGTDTPLFTHPETVGGPPAPAGELEVPDAIRRRALGADLRAKGRYVGPGRSIVVWARGTDRWRSLDARYVACDLGKWDRALDDDPGGGRDDFPDGVVAIDPERGRLRFAKASTVPTELRVTFHSGFSTDLGGGSYERRGTFSDLSYVTSQNRWQVGDAQDPLLRDDPQIDTSSDRFVGTLDKALEKALKDGSTVGARLIEIVDSRTYRPQATEIRLPAGARLVIRAANGQCPTVVLAADLSLRGGEGSRLEIDGLRISNGDLKVIDDAGTGLDRLTLRHVTLIPSSSGLDLGSNSTEARIERSIVGRIRTAPEAEVTIVDSIVDAGERTKPAYTGRTTAAPRGGPLSISRSTVRGRIDTVALKLGENSLFLGRVEVERRQEGCVRFSWIVPGSRVPRRYRCQPEEGSAEGVEPRFTSLIFGHPAYAQLDWRSPPEILRGAEDRSEMGVFSSLQQPQREDDLRARLDEYLPLGLEAGILYVT